MPEAILTVVSPATRKDFELILLLTLTVPPATTFSLEVEDVVFFSIPNLIVSILILPLPDDSFPRFNVLFPTFLITPVSFVPLSTEP